MDYPRFEQGVKHFFLRAAERFAARRVVEPAAVDLRKIRSILVVRQHDMYGDFLLSTPVFRALREHCPGVRIGALVRESFAGLLEGNTDVDEVIVVPRDRRQWSAGAFRDLYRSLRRGWDLVVVLNTVSHSLTSDILASLASPRLIAGAAFPLLPGASRNFLYNVIVPPVSGVRHQSDRNLDTIRAIGIPGTDLAERVVISEAETVRAIGRLRSLGVDGRRPLIGFHPGAGKMGNRWPVERFAALADRIAADGAATVLFWGPPEEDLRDAFVASVRAHHVLVPPSTLRDLAAGFSRCDLVVCNDTGVMHLCAAAGVPLLAFFGPTPAAEWKPWGEKFVALQGEGGVVGSISVDEAYRALRGMLPRGA
jgi:ADP-heptose:LPS heptosyltransferase